MSTTKNSFPYIQERDITPDIGHYDKLVECMLTIYPDLIPSITVVDKWRHEIYTIYRIRYSYEMMYPNFKFIKIITNGLDASMISAAL